MKNAVVMVVVSGGGMVCTTAAMRYNKCRRQPHRQFHRVEEATVGVGAEVAMGLLLALVQATSVTGTRCLSNNRRNPLPLRRQRRNPELHRALNQM